MLPTDELLSVVLAVMGTVVRVAVVVAVAEAVVARELVGTGGRRGRRGDDVNLVPPAAECLCCLPFILPLRRPNKARDRLPD